ncbi:phage/plasmid primase, P4 family [Streptomyces sp. NPDC002215]|uniref:DNA primase family protein n=1 Tax=Streptomyces sp. NPDC002215 TaxID=3154412 RepID=UPI00331DB871
MSYTSASSAVPTSRAPDDASYDAARAAQQLTADSHGRAAAVPQPVLLPDSLTDWGMAHLFLRVYGDYYRYVHSMGWYRWAEYRWVPDANTTAIRYSAMQLASNMPRRDPRADENVRYPDGELSRYRKRALSASGAAALVKMAETLPELTLRPEDLDSDPYALCTPGGVVNLRTGGMVPATPDQGHTHATAVTPRVMPTPMWNRFLTDTFGDDAAGEEMKAYIQKLCGYSISGDQAAQILAFLFGEGQNGKSVLVAVLLALLGEYADSAPPNFLMASPYADHPTELADLQGRRLVVCSEINQKSEFDEAKFKLLTGGDRIKARRMYENFYSFEPTHKLWLVGNHRPVVQAGGYGFWRRMRLIEFDRIVPSERVVDNLGSRLVASEGPGILQWLIDGAVQYFNGNDLRLDGPERVRLATQAYEESEDSVGRFLKECCVTGSRYRVLQKQLGEAYRAWCRAEDMTPVTSREFASGVRQKLHIRTGQQLPKTNGQRFFPGLGLVSESRDNGDERTGA